MMKDRNTQKEQQNLPVLDHDVLVGHQSVHAVVPALPPVVGGSLVQHQRGALLEGELAAGPAAVVEASHGLDRVRL